MVLSTILSVPKTQIYCHPSATGGRNEKEWRQLAYRGDIRIGGLETAGQLTPGPDQGFCYPLSLPREAVVLIQLCLSATHQGGIVAVVFLGFLNSGVPAFPRSSFFLPWVVSFPLTQLLAV